MRAPNTLANVKRGMGMAHREGWKPVNCNSLAEKRLIPAERRSPRLIARERRNMDTMQRVSIDEH